MSRFIIAADLHGNPPDDTRTDGYGGWLLAGDVCADHSPRTFMRWARAQPLPIWLVRGNHDCDLLRSLPNNVQDISGLVAEIDNGIVLAGVGWCGKHCTELPTNSDLEPVCKKVMAHAERFIHRRIVLLTHYPPRDYRPISQLMLRLCPIAVIYGHVHSEAQCCSKEALAGRSLMLINPGSSPGQLLITGKRTEFTPWLPP